MPGQSRPFTVAGPPAIRGEVAGEGPPVVLCHGVTATRRYVLHGSRALERAGHRVACYDARGHGESDPAPPGQGYGYPELVADLEAVVVESAGAGRPVLVGHSMGAHTVVSHALRHPEALAGIVLAGPVYDGEVDDGALAYWDGLADALREGELDGFLGYIDRESGVAEPWRDTVLRFTRERMLAHRHPQALVEALRQVPRSRPFGALRELETLLVPALVVASNDAADPGHPRRIAERYAESLPRARLIAEAEGSSPLAWQGGRFSREIASFCAEPEVRGRVQ